MPLKSRLGSSLYWYLLSFSFFFFLFVSHFTSFVLMCLVVGCMLKVVLMNVSCLALEIDFGKVGIIFFAVVFSSCLFSFFSFEVRHHMGQELNAL